MREIKRSKVYKQLSTRARSVLWTIWDHAGDPEMDFESGEVALRHARVGHDRIAELEGCDRSTVGRALRKLRKAGLVEWIVTGRKNAFVLFPP